MYPKNIRSKNLAIAIWQPWGKRLVSPLPRCIAALASSQIAVIELWAANSISRQDIQHPQSEHLIQISHVDSDFLTWHHFLTRRKQPSNLSIFTVGSLYLFFQVHISRDLRMEWARKGEALNGDIRLSLKHRNFCFLLLLYYRTVLFGWDQDRLI